MTYAVDYDVDQNTMPSTVQLRVRCIDSLGKTGTTLLIITIRVNPVFSIMMKMVPLLTFLPLEKNPQILLYINMHLIIFLYESTM